MLDELDAVYLRKNTLKCLHTKRKLLSLVFDEKKEATTHLAKFERIINELKAAGEEIKKKRHHRQFYAFTSRIPMIM